VVLVTLNVMRWRSSTIDRLGSREGGVLKVPVAAREIIVTGVLAVLVTLGGAVLFYGPGIATGSELFFTHDVSHSDVWHLNLPMKQLYDRALAEGRLPLWAPELGTGFPLLAQGQVGALYPLNLLLYGLLPLVLAFNWSVLLHAALAAGFAAMLARQLGARRDGGLLAGVVFAFCGFFVVHVKHVSITAAAIWAPLLILIVERYATTRRARHVALFAIVVATMLFAGHPQIAYYALLTTGGWLLARLVFLVTEGRSAGGAGPRPWTFAVGLAYAVLLGVLLAAPQLLPTRELNDLGPRHGGLTLEEATEWRYEWAHLAAFVRPGVHGDPGVLTERPYVDGSGREVAHPETGEPLRALEGYRHPGDGKSLYWEVTGYVGILPLVLAAVALAFGIRRRAVVMLAALLLVSLLLVLGPGGGLFHLFWNAVPGFRYFRFQSRFLLFADLALALLAGIGWTLASARLTPRARLLTAVVVVAVCFADLWISLGGHNPTVAADHWLTAPPTATRIEREEAGSGEPFRIVGNDPQRAVFKNAYFRARGWTGDLAPYDAAQLMLGPNLSALYGLDNLEIFYPLYPQWMGDTVRLLRVRPGRVHSGFASLFNVKYVLDAFGSTPVGMSVLESFPAGERLPDGIVFDPPVPRYPPFEVRLLENAGVFPRAFVVSGARTVVDRPVPRGSIPDSVRALVDPGLDPRLEVLIVQEPGETAPDTMRPGEAIAAPVEFLSYGPREVHLRVNPPRPAWLVLSDTYYPGWRAEVNGVPQPIYRANVSVRAIALDGGPADVVFRYAPSSFRNGWFAAFIGVALLATLTFQRRLLGRSRRPHS